VLDSSNKQRYDGEWEHQIGIIPTKQSWSKFT